MAQGDTQITVVGNIVADPELRYTPNGAAVANFRVASTPRRYDQQAGQFVDGEPLFLTCNVWRQPAENVANSLSKGDRVIVTGRLRQRSYDDRNGERRTVFEIEVEEVGPSLRFATADINKSFRGGGQGGQGQGNGGNGGFGGGNAGGQGGFGGGNAGGQGQGNRGQNNQGFGGRNAAMDDDPWNSAPQSGFGDGDDEPPF
ncbi:single-stranded DNA-binding protein [Corynebacterium jeikeium]|jgi:single-strand DNA-binding protein|uniref:Single-stranded DNA-binding protein n=1 Tax=Corynebacterium jeikeium (strain K411) TaxID=306537 RepID=Q4JSG0_CORJK|nr:single-stranded DNA-binding protein [Corynebacterium jeikeium]EEW15672.1 single-strand binding family protein [Corynebacterium jeikeium ATCC 43734]OOD34716.1 single-stranded DNA-binding protein [Corynebacterium jeikeium]WCZ54719.1 Single-stranded DNA-binding protein [Corynebacterium jeikeium]CAI38247.1 ssb1 [Corynebacterium jeikeium K411]SQI18870.1 single-stranded DNA-binding protein [Corynebacterium jeikeium]